jgi:hypothetical protein
MTPTKGFLIRGELRPQMGTVQGQARNASAALGRHVPVMPPKNRIPSSITVKRNPGLR